jgi:DNA-binding transcriptional regulator YdaS (Cro superfamily)
MSWLTTLRAEVARTSQARVALRLGVSEGTVSQVLSGTYKASTQRIERRVRGVLLGEVVECPVAFEMPLQVCQAIQDRPADKRFGNPVHARAWLCCKGRGEFTNAGPCPHAAGQAAATNDHTNDQEASSS